MSQVTSESPSSLPRLPDSRRIQKILDELSSKTVDNRGIARPFSNIDDKAKVFLMEYAIEITNSVLESSKLLAIHRDSNEVNADDINLILAKKLGIEIAGQPRIKALHQHNMKSLYAPATSKQSSYTIGNVPIASNQSTTQSVRAVNSNAFLGDSRKQGAKRKFNTPLAAPPS